MHIGPYEVVNTLGKGGMGAVFVARDPAIDRLVAIKLLRDGIDSPELRERFKREARSAGKLRHPNIVTIFHVGEYEARPYIVMEYIPGETLAEIIKLRRPMSIGRKIRIIEDVCRGLAYAHKAGIVHRDVKPLNILVDPEGVVKILDFGIARINDQQLTQLGMMMGTPNYMAPEQITPGHADHRSDVFAVGLVLYELLTFQRAFPGDNFSVLQKVLQEEPEPVEKYCPNIDPELVGVLTRALAKKPDERYQDLAAMRQDLRRVWARVHTPEDEFTSDEAPATPTHATNYDGPTLAGSPVTQTSLETRPRAEPLAGTAETAAHPPDAGSESDPARSEPTRGDDERRSVTALAREFARVAEEKRQAEEAAQTRGVDLSHTQREPPATEIRPPVDQQPHTPSSPREQTHAGDDRPGVTTRSEADQQSVAAAEATSGGVTGKLAPSRSAQQEKKPSSTPAGRSRSAAKARPPVTNASTLDATMVYRRPAANAEPPKAAGGSGTASTAAPAAPKPPAPSTGAAARPVGSTPAPTAAPKAAAGQSTSKSVSARSARQTEWTAAALAMVNAQPAWVLPTAAAVVVLIVFIGGWFLFRGNSNAEPPAAMRTTPGNERPGLAPEPAPPGSTPAEPTAAGGTAPGAPGAATDPVAQPPAPPAPSVDLRTRVEEALQGNDVEGALRIIEGEAAQNDPAASEILVQVVDAARRNAARAFDRAQRAGAARTAAEDYRSALAKRAEGDASSRDGHHADAAHAFMEASDLFTRAATAAIAARPTAPGPTLASDTAVIRTVLQQYEAAYKQMDMNAIRSVWPGAPASMNFNNIRSFSVTVVDPQISVDKDTATVSAVRRIDIEREGGHRETSPKTVFTLRRISGGWVIDRIE
jgi:serine/threonine protein kinase